MKYHHENSMSQLTSKHFEKLPKQGKWKFDIKKLKENAKKINELYKNEQKFALQTENK